MIHVCLQFTPFIINAWKRKFIIFIIHINSICSLGIIVWCSLAFSLWRPLRFWSILFWTVDPWQRRLELRLMRLCVTCLRPKSALIWAICLTIVLIIVWHQLHYKEQNPVTQMFKLSFFCCYISIEMRKPRDYFARNNFRWGFRVKI